jgi:excisionase family DNA binding protein
MAIGFEKFVDADVIAEYLSIKRKTVLGWARQGLIPAYPLGAGRRKVWRFLISEIASQKKLVQGTINTGSPEMARTEKSRG